MYIETEGRVLLETETGRTAFRNADGTWHISDRMGNFLCEVPTKEEARERLEE